MGCLKRVLTWCILIFVFIFVLMSDNLSVGTAAAICTFCVGLFAFLWWMEIRSINRGLSKPFEYYADALSGLSPEEITKILLQEELRNMQCSRPLAAESVRWYLGTFAVLGVLNFLLLNFAYYTRWCVVLCSVLAIIGFRVCLRHNSLDIMCRYAKNNPYLSLEEVAKNTLAANQRTAWKKVMILPLTMVLVPIVVIVCLHTKPVITYTLSNDGYVVSKYQPALNLVDSVDIPEYHEGKQVTAIGKRAFANIKSLKTVTMPDSVLSIGDQAFAGCSGLETVKLSSELRFIGSGAFRNCSTLEEIQLPGKLTELLGESFMNTGLKHITIPEGVKEIRGNTFDGCTQLEEVQLHDGIVDIHAYAFRNCKKLEAITLPPKITEIHTYTFENCASLLTIEIPVGVTRIAAHAFYGCNSLEYVYVPDTVREIGSSAFRLCNSLLEIELPPGVAVDERAFKESPTRQLKKQFTDEQVQQILEEISNKEAEQFYYVYAIAEPDTVVSVDISIVLFTDDIRYEEYLEDGYALQKMDSEEELLAYLEKAKQAGMQEAVYAVRSQVASDITHTEHFASMRATLDEWITELNRMITEKENG